MLKLLAQREQRLHAAGEIHRFHRDVAEALFRIQVSLMSIAVIKNFIKISNFRIRTQYFQLNLEKI